MFDIPWISSTIVSVISSTIIGTGSYFLGCHKQYIIHYNMIIDEINLHFDKLFEQANTIIGSPFSDSNYHMMVYDVDKLSVLWSQLNNRDLHFDPLPLKRILTDTIFESNTEEKSKETMRNLSTLIHNYKKLLKKRFI